MDQVWSPRAGPAAPLGARRMPSLITAGFDSTARLCCAFQNTEAIKVVYIPGLVTQLQPVLRQRALKARDFIPRFWAQKQERRPPGQPSGSEAVLLLSPDTQHPGFCGPGWPCILFLMRQCTHQRARSQGPRAQHPPCRLLTFTGVQLPAGPTPRSQSPFSGPSRPLLTSHLQHPSSLSPAAWCQRLCMGGTFPCKVHLTWGCH